MGTEGLENPGHRLVSMAFLGFYGVWHRAIEPFDQGFYRSVDLVGGQWMFPQMFHDGSRRTPAGGASLANSGMTPAASRLNTWLWLGTNSVT